jgi:restriction endonuclease S subunit
MENNMQTIELLCGELTTGATNTLFEKSEQQDRSGVQLLTGSSLNLNGEIVEQQLTAIKVKEGKNIQRFQLQEGDVVLLAKGNSIRAGYVTAKIANLNVIASANFILLRPNKDKLVGEVLVAYLNSTSGQNRLNAISTGAAIQNVSLSNLKKEEIELPALEKQYEIAELFHASNQAYKSTIDLANQQNKAATACINQLMKGAA